jgi:hypothetical protein
MSNVVGPQQNYRGGGSGGGNPFAVAGFVCALVGLVPFVGLVSTILAIIFSAIGLKRASLSGVGRGLAIAGLVIGIVLCLPALFLLIGALAG